MASAETSRHKDRDRESRPLQEPRQRPQLHRPPRVNLIPFSFFAFRGVEKMKKNVEEIVMRLEEIEAEIRERFPLPLPGEEPEKVFNAVGEFSKRLATLLGELELALSKEERASVRGFAAIELARLLRLLAEALPELLRAFVYEPEYP